MNDHTGMMRIKLRLRTVLLTLILALLSAGLISAAEASGSNDRNGHMSWGEFFSAWSSGAFEDDEEEDGGDELPETAKGDTVERSQTAGDDAVARTEISGDTGEDLPEIAEDGIYTSKEEVAAYLNTYGRLPENYITKKEARKLGWDSSAGNLDTVAPGMSIGGDYFGNYEGSLPEKKGRTYYECDIDYTGGYRGAKRIIYSDDGLIYYTEDHYRTFELLYGEE